MTSNDRRRATRVALEVPAAVLGRSGALDAEVRDVSLSGVRLFLRAESLDLPVPPDLLEAALAVKSALAETFPVKLDFEKATEIERAATLARLVLPSYEPGCIELGCMFAEPLTPEDLTRLCGASPRVGASDRRAVPRVGPSEDEPSAPEPQVESGEDLAPAREDDRGPVKHPLRVFVSAKGEEKPLLCHSTHVDHEGLHVRASDAAIGAEDAVEAALLFSRRYGTAVSLKIVDGVRPLWSGPADILGMEILFDRPGDLLLTVALARDLRTDDLERLGLRSRVA